MKHLFIINHPPYANDSVKESIDMALALAAFDQEVTLVFSDLGVWNLVDNQNPKIVGLKEFTRVFKALDLYDIENVYVDQSALIDYSLNTSDLMIQPKLVDAQEVKRLINDHQRVYNI